MKNPLTSPGIFRRLARYAVPGFAVLVLAAIPLLAFARAGGGEGFGGGGGGGDSGGGGFGGGDGGGGGGGGEGIDLTWLIYLVYLLIRLCNERPVVGIPLTLAIITFFIYAAVRGQSRLQSSVLQRGSLAGDANAHAQAVETLRANDPAFDPVVFLARVERAFVKVQTAWADQNLEAMRPFVSDGIAERFALQLQEQRDAGYRNVVENISVLHATLASARRGGVLETVTVSIRASASDYRVSLADGKFLSGSKSPEQFVEFWTFVRSGKARSLAPGAPGLIEGNCPNCGAPVASKDSREAGGLGGSAKCGSCQSLLRSGVHDWVLASITQGKASILGAGVKNEASIAAYQAGHDAGFCPENIEDRASVVFWRWAKAQRVGRAAPLGKVAEPAFVEATAADLKRAVDAQGRRTYIGSCAVGAVDTLGVINDAEWDRALVRIEWQGMRKIVSPGEKPAVAPGGGLAVWIMTLVRRPGGVSDPEKGLSSAHCPSCGAAQSDDAADVCAYCQTVLNDGVSAWIVRSIANVNSPGAQAALAELSRGSGGGDEGGARAVSAASVPASAEGMIAWLADVIVDDDVITHEEHRLFRAVCEQQQIPMRRAEEVLEAAIPGPESNAPAPANTQEARRWMEVLAGAIAKHGKIEGENRALLSIAAKKLGLSEWDLRDISRDLKTRSLREARDAIRQNKSRRG